MQGAFNIHFKECRAIAGLEPMRFLLLPLHKHTSRLCTIKIIALSTNIIMWLITNESACVIQDTDTHTHSSAPMIPSVSCGSVMQAVK